MITGFQFIENQICSLIKDELDKIGLHYKIFSRTKDEKSILEKIERKKNEGKEYQVGQKLIQDVIGIRVVTYFRDDIEIVKKILSAKFEFFEEEVDSPELTVFKPKRTNIICTFKDDHKKIFSEVIKQEKKEFFKLLDSKFELQFRTILSEGWHEIDHSLRYKCQSDWEGHYENERLLNGIYASLETNDIALKNLFNELAYLHFKNKNWEGLLRNKFRLRFQLTPLKEDIQKIMNANPEIGKSIIKLERDLILLKIHSVDLSLPMNFSNLIFLINAFFINNKALVEITPDIIIKELEAADSEI